MAAPALKIVAILEKKGDRIAGKTSFITRSRNYSTKVDLGWYNTTMSAERLTISTITWARDKKEEKSIYGSLSTLSNKNIHIVAVDGGSSEEFLNNLKNLRNISIIRSLKKGVQNQAVESLNKAQSYSEYVFYTESNKGDFFRNNLDEFLSKANSIIDKDPNAGVILPSRTKESFSTYPVFQQQSESFLNTILGEFLNKKAIDFSYGPRIITGDLIPYVGQLPRDISWGWMTYLLFVAENLGKNTYAVDLDLPCPKDERIETESDKLFRLKQLRNHIEAVEEGLKFKRNL